ncbi:hypothetical protein Tco_1362837 [Tanacetum coccineum]
MSELSDDAIGVYHRIFYFFGVRIPSSSFLLALIKNYKVHFSQLGLLGLNKVVTFETGVEVQEEPYHDIRPTLQRLPLYCTSPADVDAAISNPTSEDLTAGNPSAKVVAKSEASQKRKASTFGATSSHVSKYTRSALAQSSGSTTHPNPFAENSDDESNDDACVEISFVTLIRFAIVIPSSWNRSRGSAAPAAEGTRAQDSQGKDTINRDFFCFSPGPYYATYFEGGVTGNCEFSREEYNAPHQPTFTILTKEVFKDPSVCITVVDQFPTPGEMVARFNDKLSSFGAAFAKSKAKGKERKKKIKSLTKSLDNLHAEVARLSADLNWATVLEAEKDKEILSLKATPWSLHPSSRHVIEPLSVILQLEPEKLARPANVPASRDALVSPIVVKESIVTPAFASVDLPSNTVPTSSVAILEPNEEWENAMVDGPDHEMTDRATDANLGSVFVQGSSHTVDNDSELTLIRSERVSSGLSDVVMALSFGGKGDGSLPSSTIDKKVAATSSGVALVPSVVHWYMFSPRHCCSSELFAQKEEVIITPPPALCQSFHVLTLPSHVCFVFIGKMRDPEHVKWGCYIHDLFPVFLSFFRASKFKRIAYEYIFSSGPSRIRPTPEPSLSASLLKYNLHALGVGVSPVWGSLLFLGAPSSFPFHICGRSSFCLRNLFTICPSVSLVQTYEMMYVLISAAHLAKRPPVPEIF